MPPEYGAVFTGLHSSRVQTSEVSDFSEATMIFGSVKRIHERNLWEGFSELVQKCQKAYAFTDYFGFAQVLEGAAEIMLEPRSAPWDVAPMKILAEESGGRFSDLNGGSSIYSNGCIVTNHHIHRSVLSVLGITNR